MPKSLIMPLPEAPLRLESRSPEEIVDSVADISREFRRHSALVGSLFAVLASALLILAARAPWWHLIGVAEPRYFYVAHFAAAVVAIVVLCALVLSRFRPRLFSPALLLGAGCLTLLVTIGTILWLALFDAPSIGNAVEQLDQANSLIATLMRTAINPQVPWTEATTIITGGLRRNDYTVADVLETTMHFAQAGWFLSCLGGLLLLLSAWLLDGNGVRRILFAIRLQASIGLLICLALLFGRMSISRIYWNDARTEQASGRYAASLMDYRSAARWDPRLEYDRFYHFNLGRVYQALGMTTEPDYWAMLGDIMLSQSVTLPASRIYRDHIDTFDNSPSLRFRYADMLYQVGCYHYVRQEYAAAADSYLQSLRMDPNNVLARYGLGLTCTKVGNFDQAIPLWQSLIRDNEGISIYQTKYFVSGFAYRKVITSRAWSYLAWCYYRQHDTPHALAAQVNANSAGNAPLDDDGE